MKVLVYGACGTMGKVLKEHLASLSIEFVLVDPYSCEEQVYTSLEEAPKVDVLIDFSHPSQTETIINYGLNNALPLVIGTTGHQEVDHQKFEDASRRIPIFKSANLSFGIHLLHKILKQYTALLEENYDIEIVETHHRNKVDAPSGTAYLLAQSIQSGAKTKKELVLNRSDVLSPRKNNQIGMSAIRGGNIIGEHTVSFYGDSDVIEFSHRAQSKKLFTEGAIKAAAYIIKQSPGLYTMNDLIKERSENNE